MGLTDLAGGGGGGGLSNPLAAGTVAATSIQIVNAGTGLYQPAANDLGIAANGVDVVRAHYVASAVNYIDLTPAVAGSPAIVGAAGADTDVALLLKPKGAGLVQANAPVKIPNGTNVSPGLQSSGGSTAIGTTDASSFFLCSNGTYRWNTHASLGNFLDAAGNGGGAALIFGVSVGTPPYAFIGALTSGMGESATNVPAIFSNGTEVARWSAKSCVRVSTQFDKTSNTTLGDITGLSVSVLAGRTYTFEACLFTTSNVAGGVQAAIAGTCTATAIRYEGVLDNANALGGQTRATALATAVAAVTAVTVATIWICGTITVNAAGTLTVQFAQNASNATASSVLTGSYFLVWDNP